MKRRKFSKVTDEQYRNIKFMTELRDENGNQMSYKDIGKLVGFSDCTVSRIANSPTFSDYRKYAEKATAQRNARNEDKKNDPDIESLYETFGAYVPENEYEPKRQTTSPDLHNTIDAIDLVIEELANLRYALKEIARGQEDHSGKVDTAE